MPEAISQAERCLPVDDLNDVGEADEPERDVSRINESSASRPRPPERKWNIGHDALLRLVDLAIAHLFKELYWREHHEWLGEEAPHEAPKMETSEKPPSLDAGRRGVEITSRMSGRV